jgi:hypothetical protein
MSARNKSNCKADYGRPAKSSDLIGTGRRTFIPSSATVVNDDCCEEMANAKIESSVEQSIVLFEIGEAIHRYRRSSMNVK